MSDDIPLPISIRQTDKPGGTSILLRWDVSLDRRFVAQLGGSAVVTDLLREAIGNDPEARIGFEADHAERHLWRIALPEGVADQFAKRHNLGVSGALRRILDNAERAAV